VCILLAGTIYSRGISNKNYKEDKKTSGSTTNHHHQNNRKDSSKENNQNSYKYCDDFNDPNEGEDAGDRKKPKYEENKKDSSEWDTSDDGDIRNHRYKNLAKIYEGRSLLENPLEIDHIIPMAVWKMLLAEIKKYPERDLPKHLQRALKIFRIILKNKDIYSLNSNDLDRLKGEFPAIEILKEIHRKQFTTGNRQIRVDFNDLLIKFILRGQWDKVIEYIFRDQYNIAKYINVGQDEIEKLRERQRSFVKYLQKKCILTDAMAKILFDVINNLSTLWDYLLNLFQKKYF